MSARSGKDFTAQRTRGKDSRNSRQRARKWYSSTTTSGVPNSSASSLAFAPAMVKPSAVSSAAEGQGAASVCMLLDSTPVSELAVRER
jgi:hypothetical protein